MSDSNELIRNPVTILTSGTRSSSTGSSASNIVHSLRDDNPLADDVGRVLGSPLRVELALSCPTCISLLLLDATFHMADAKRGSQNHDMKLVLVDFILEVNNTGKTESYDGSVLLDAPFRVRENGSDSSIRTRILAIVKSRFPSFNETVLYASRQGIYKKPKKQTWCQ